MRTLTLAEAMARAQELGATRDRAIVGLAGAPGAGKSTVAAALSEAVPGSVVVGMDGFHLAHSTLAALGWVERKGAMRTFDADGYVALLRRVRAREPRTVWAPEFRREIDDAVAGAVAVSPQTRLVITEGNYLLVEAAPWAELPALCDEIWYVETPEPARLRRLARRHQRYGRTAAQAWQRAMGSDGQNAAVVAATRDRADLVVALPDDG